MADSVVSSMSLKPSPVVVGRSPVRGLPSLARSSTSFRVLASGGKKIKTSTPYGPGGGASFDHDASGRKAKGKGVYQFANKYGANVDGYSNDLCSPRASPAAMASSGKLSLFLVVVLLPLLISPSRAARFEVVNSCPYTVWAAAVPGGGRQLDPSQAWTFDVNPGTTGGRVWARTGCSFDGSGRGGCQTGDCGGALACSAYGRPPNTLAEYGLNQFNNLDFFDISLVDGFNVPMDFSPTSGGCRGVRCAADINGQCPAELRAMSGGCNNPCTVFRTDEYCCNSGSCGPTGYSRFFKERCPDAYSYPKDDQTSTVLFTCPGGANYRVVFCP